MSQQLVEWTCNIETHECLWMDRRVLSAIIVLIVAIVAIGVGYLIDACLAEQRKSKGGKWRP